MFGRNDKDTDILIALVSIERQLVKVNRKLDAMSLLGRLDLNMELLSMTLAQDIKENVAKVAAAAQANTDATSAVAGVLEGVKAQVASVQEAFDAYVAAHPGDAELEGIMEALDAITAEVDADTLAEKALAGTSEEFPPPGDPVPEDNGDFP